MATATLDNRVKCEVILVILSFLERHLHTSNISLTNHKQQVVTAAQYAETVRWFQ